jgi:hypothetical protein
MRTMRSMRNMTTSISTTVSRVIGKKIVMISQT